jgi:hypothetical protein
VSFVTWNFPHFCKSFWQRKEAAAASGRPEHWHVSSQAAGELEEQRFLCRCFLLSLHSSTRPLPEHDQETEQTTQTADDRACAQRTLLWSAIPMRQGPGYSQWSILVLTCRSPGEKICMRMPVFAVSEARTGGSRTIDSWPSPSIYYEGVSHLRIPLPKMSEDTLG